MFCTQCGAKLSDDARFCTSCGAKTNEQMSSGVTATAPENAGDKITRKVTITRRARFVGCLAKAKIYVTDSACEDSIINGEKCRLLGILKSGETKTFEIGTGSCKLYAIYDKLSKAFCKDCYPVPEGAADLTLTGEAKFNPGAGNPFYFDGVTDPEILKSRKKGNIGWLLLIAAAVVGFALGYFIMSLILK